MGEDLVAAHITHGLDYCRDRVALDVGANYGVYTAMLAPRVREVYAFEPHPSNLPFLADAVKEFGNCIVVPWAVSDRKGTVRMYSNWNPGGHTISEVVGTSPTWGHAPSLTVGSVTIDEYCSALDVGFIKIDVEGAEERVLRGAEATLRRNRMTIALETHQTIDREAIHAFLTDCGYRCHAGGAELAHIDFDSHYIWSNL